MNLAIKHDSPPRSQPENTAEVLITKKAIAPPPPTCGCTPTSRWVYDENSVDKCHLCGNPMDLSYWICTGCDEECFTIAHDCPEAPEKRRARMRVVATQEDDLPRYYAKRCAEIQRRKRIAEFYRKRADWIRRGRPDRCEYAQIPAESDIEF